MSRLRELGVIGKNAPTKKTKSIQASDFLVGGIHGFFERRYKRAFLVNNFNEYRNIFGEHINSNYFAPDCVKGFFDNVVGVNASLYVKAYVGNTGSAYDAVTAFSNAQDTQTSPQNILKIESAYKDTLEFSESGNRTGYKITRGNRFTTTVIATSTTSKLYLASTVGFIVGDLVAVDLTGGTEYGKVLLINESEKSITLVSPLSIAPTLSITVRVLGFQLRTYRKTIGGVVTEIESVLGDVWCTTESEVTDYFVENIFKKSSLVKVTVLTTSTTPDKKLPATLSSIVFLSSGSNGTSPTLAAQWAYDIVAFNGLPIRLLTLVESANDSIQKSVENYCKSRSDTPIAITHTLKDQDKSQLVDIGRSYQRSDDVFQVLIGTWLGVDDLFSTNITASDRIIPPNGHVLGIWIRSIATKGIHYIPTKDISIFGVNSIYNPSLGTITNRDRTDLAEAGINIIQELSGIGIILRNLFTCSVSTDFQFANGIILRNFIKLSIEESLQNSENTPNSYNQIAIDRDAIFNFMRRLWDVGSTGNVPAGETFGQFLKDDGKLSTFNDSVEINIDPPVNTLQSIQAGERNYEVYFRYSSPAGSIFIFVGILL